MKSNKAPLFFNKTKRHFILIEVLIAIALISVFSIPLIRNPIYFCKSQIKSLEKIECERLADLAFLDIKIGIYKKEISVNNLENRVEDAIKIPFKSYFLDSLQNKEIKSFYKLNSHQTKETPNNEIYKIVKIKLYLQPIDQKKSYTYNYKIVCKK